MMQEKDELMQKKYMKNVTAVENSHELLIKEFAEKMEMEWIDDKRCFFLYCNFEDLVKRTPKGVQKHKSLVTADRFEMSYALMARVDHQWIKNNVLYPKTRKAKLPVELSTSFKNSLLKDVR